MPLARVKVADGLLLHGQQLTDEDMDRDTFREALKLGKTTFYSASAPLGGHTDKRGLRAAEFFVADSDGRMRFGAGAGLIIGLSLGIANVRAGLFDANGTMYHEESLDPDPEQLTKPPAKLLERIEQAATAVLVPALKDPSLHVAGKLRFRGIAIAWPCPINRENKPSGHFIDPAWAQIDLTKKVADQLELKKSMSHALNDARASAIAVAFNHCRASEYVGQPQPELTLVLRMSGGINCETIVIEPHEEGKSGFIDSIVLGGIDLHAGELGHASLTPGLIAEISKRKDGGLGKPSPGWCSCTVPGHEDHPHHLEAFAGRLALAERVDPERDPESVIQDIIRDPESTVHRRALEDVGTMTGDALRGAVAMLNPARIVLTGALALEPVKEAMDKRLEEKHRVNAHPQVETLQQGEDFIAAKGAALAVIREQVYRQFSTLLASPLNKVTKRLQSGPHVEDITALPWKKSRRK